MLGILSAIPTPSGLFFDKPSAYFTARVDRGHVNHRLFSGRSSEATDAPVTSFLLEQQQELGVPLGVSNLDLDYPS